MGLVVGLQPTVEQRAEIPDLASTWMGVLSCTAMVLLSLHPWKYLKWGILFICLFVCLQLVHSNGWSRLSGLGLAKSGSTSGPKVNMGASSSGFSDVRHRSKPSDFPPSFRVRLLRYCPLDDRSQTLSMAASKTKASVSFKWEAHLIFLEILPLPLKDKCYVTQIKSICWFPALNWVRNERPVPLKGNFVTAVTAGISFPLFQYWEL